MVKSQKQKDKRGPGMNAVSGSAGGEGLKTSSWDTAEGRGVYGCIDRNCPEIVNP